jgi:hypothetical protein
VTRLLADIACVLLVIVGHLIALPLFALHGIREGASARVERAALLWDLMIAALLGAEAGETVSTMAARKRGRWCVLCQLLAIRWPGHCEDASDVLFITVRTRRTTNR